MLHQRRSGIGSSRNVPSTEQAKKSSKSGSGANLPSKKEWNTYLTDGNQYRLPVDKLLLKKKLLVSTNNVFNGAGAEKENFIPKSKPSHFADPNLTIKARTPEKQPKSLNSYTDEVDAIDLLKEDKIKSTPTPVKRKSKTYCTPDKSTNISVENKTPLSSRSEQTASISRKTNNTLAEKSPVSKIVKERRPSTTESRRTTACTSGSAKNKDPNIKYMVEEVRTLFSELKYYEELSGRQSILDTREEMENMLKDEGLASEDKLPVMQYLANLACQSLSYLLKSEAELREERGKYEVLFNKYGEIARAQSQPQIDRTMESIMQNRSASSLGVSLAGTGSLSGTSTRSAWTDRAVGDITHSSLDAAVGDLYAALGITSSHSDVASSVASEDFSGADHLRGTSQMHELAKAYAGDALYPVHSEEDITGVKYEHGISTSRAPSNSSDNPAALMGPIGQFMQRAQRMVLPPQGMSLLNASASMASIGSIDPLQVHNMSTASAFSAQLPHSAMRVDETPARWQEVLAKSNAAATSSFPKTSGGGLSLVMQTPPREIGDGSVAGTPAAFLNGSMATTPSVHLHPHLYRQLQPLPPVLDSSSTPGIASNDSYTNNRAIMHGQPATSPYVDSYSSYAKPPAPSTKKKLVYSHISGSVERDREAELDAKLQQAADFSRVDELIAHSRSVGSNHGQHISPDNIQRLASPPAAGVSARAIVCDQSKHIEEGEDIENTTSTVDRLTSFIPSPAKSSIRQGNMDRSIVSAMMTPDRRQQSVSFNHLYDSTDSLPPPPPPALPMSAHVPYPPTPPAAQFEQTERFMAGTSSLNSSAMASAPSSSFATNDMMSGTSVSDWIFQKFEPKQNENQNVTSFNSAIHASRTISIGKAGPSASSSAHKQNEVMTPPGVYVRPLEGVAVTPSREFNPIRKQNASAAPKATVEVKMPSVSPVTEDLYAQGKTAATAHEVDRLVAAPNSESPSLTNVTKGSAKPSKIPSARNYSAPRSRDVRPVHEMTETGTIIVPNKHVPRPIASAKPAHPLHPNLDSKSNTLYTKSTPRIYDATTGSF